MKIAFLSNKDPSIPEIDTDGGAVTPRHYALELGRRGHTIDIYTPQVLVEDSHNTYLRDKCSAQKENEKSLEKNVKVIRLPVKTVNRSQFITGETRDLAGIVESFLFADAFGQEQFEGYDLINFFHPLTAYGIINRRKVNPTRTVLFPMLLSDHYLKYQSLSRAYCEIEQLLLTEIGHIFSPTQDERRILTSRGIPEEKIKLVYQGFDETLFYPKIRYQISRKTNERVSIVCTNAIRPQKAQHQLVYIADLLKREGINPRVIIVGENNRFYKPEHEEYYKNLKSLIERNNLQNNFNFMGAVTPNIVAHILRSADIAVYPSESESFGKSILEAIATGIPAIIGNDIPVYEEFVKPDINALSVERRPEGFFKAIKHLINDENLYRNISKQGVESTKKFTWEKVTQKLEELYEMIIFEANKR